MMDRPMIDQPGHIGKLITVKQVDHRGVSACCRLCHQFDNALHDPLPHCVQGARYQWNTEPREGDNDEISFGWRIGRGERVVAISTIRSRPRCQPTAMKAARGHEIKASRADRKIGVVSQRAQSCLGCGGRRHAGATKNAGAYTDSALDSIGCLSQGAQGQYW